MNNKFLHITTKQKTDWKNLDSFDSNTDEKQILTLCKFRTKNKYTIKIFH